VDFSGTRDVVELIEGEVVVLSGGLPRSLCAESSEMDNFLRLAGVEDLRTIVSEVRTSYHSGRTAWMRHQAMLYV
jgi:hypothetical protein